MARFWKLKTSLARWLETVYYYYPHTHKWQKTEHMISNNCYSGYGQKRYLKGSLTNGFVPSHKNVIG